MRWLVGALAMGCSGEAGEAPPLPETVDSTLSTAFAGDRVVAWREHLIDDAVELAGSDGLAVGDVDGDGLEDVVSVHEDSGHVRLALRRGEGWVLSTLSSEADGAEDVDLGDVDGDGDLDAIVACEGGTLLFLRNLGDSWEEEPIVEDRGSFIRATWVDLDGDGALEVLAANKGLVLHEAGTEASPGAGTILDVLTAEPTPVSVFSPPDWRETELVRLRVPLHAVPVDLDDDGDLDVLTGGRGELDGLVWLEQSDDGFSEHTLALEDWEPLRALGLPLLNGQTLHIADLDGDGDPDVLTLFTLGAFGWLEHPGDPGQPWIAHVIGDLSPDHVIGLELADIDGDGRRDVMVGGYSKGPRLEDGDVGLDDPLGRLAWYRRPAEPHDAWTRHDVSRRKRGMFDAFAARDIDGDGDLDFYGTRGNSAPHDGVFWLEQLRVRGPVVSFQPAREQESEAVPLSR